MLSKRGSGKTAILTLPLLPVLFVFAVYVQAANISGISGGIWHSGAVDDTGAVWTWGANSAGQLGDGTNENAHYPVRVIDTTAPTGYLYDVASVGAGRGSGSLFESHSIALKQDGTVWAWGWNAYGQLGVSEVSAPVSSVPVQVSGLMGINTIDAGTKYNLALKNPEGSVWAWGENNSGQLGIDPVATSSSSTPLSITGLAGITAIAAGDNHGLAVKSDTSVWAWGGGDWGALGDGSTESGVVLNPVQVVYQANDPLIGITRVDAGAWFSLARKSDGTVWSWGVNESGQLGDGSNDYRKSAALVSGLANITHIAAGGQHALARRDDGTVWAWGLNSSGQLGNNSTTASNVPVQVLDPADLTGKLTGVIAIGAGKDTSFAIKSNGTAWGWGNNYAAQIGVGEDQTNKLLPVQILFTDKSNRMFELLGPYFITPGEAVHYVVRYKNVANEILDDTIIAVGLPPTMEYKSSGSDGIYWNDKHQVFWKLGDLEPGDSGGLSLEVNIRWGLEPHSLSSAFAFIGARNLPSVLDIDEYLAYEDVLVTQFTQLSDLAIQALLSGDQALNSNLQYALGLGYEFPDTAFNLHLSDGTTYTTLTLIDPVRFEPLLLYRFPGAVFFERSTDSGHELFDRSGGLKVSGEPLDATGWGDWNNSLPIKSVTNSQNPAYCNYLCVKETIPKFYPWMQTKIWPETSQFKHCILCKQSLKNNVTDRLNCGICAYEYTAAQKDIEEGSRTKKVADCVNSCIASPNTWQCEPGAQTRYCTYGTLELEILAATVSSYLNTAGKPWVKARAVCQEVGGGTKWVETDIKVCTPDRAWDVAYCVMEEWGPECTSEACSRVDRVFDSFGSSSLSDFSGQATCVYKNAEARIARDPNEKSVNVVGDVLPGQTLNYTIDYENVGAGTAYEVFILDQLDEDLDADSLLIRGGGNYIETTRLLGWDIGELGAAEQGKVSFSVDVLSDLPAGSEIINTADIYFPSAGEITPTNALVNRVASIKAEPQDVQTTGRTPVVIDLYGKDTLGSSLDYEVTSGPLYGELTGMPPSVVYTAMSEFSGMDELHFTTSNGSVTSEPARVTITVLPDPADTHPPGVIRTSPTADETGVVAGTTPVVTDPDLYTPFITAAFSEPMDSATVTDTTFTVDGLTGTVGYDELTRQATFSPATPLAAATTYTARLHTGITDKLDNALQDQYSWQFTTASPANISVSLPDPVVDTVDLRVSPVGSLSDERIVTVSNTGHLDLEIGSLVITGLHAVDFQLEADGCSNNTLPPGSYCTVSLAFQPGAVGIREALLTIPSNDTVVPSHEVPLTGLGVTPFCSGDAVTINSRTFPAGLSICDGTSSVTTSSTAGTNITVPSQADVYFVAPQISLNNGFKINAGGYFHSGARYTPIVLPEP